MGGSTIPSGREGVEATGGSPISASCRKSNACGRQYAILTTADNLRTPTLTDNRLPVRCEALSRGEKAADPVHDAAGGVSVTVGVSRRGHGPMRLRVGKQPRRMFHDAGGMGTRQEGSAGLNALRPLGRVAHDEHRLGQ